MTRTTDRFELDPLGVITFFYLVFSSGFLYGSVPACVEVSHKHTQNIHTDDTQLSHHARRGE